MVRVQSLTFKRNIILLKLNSDYENWKDNIAGENS